MRQRKTPNHREHSHLGGFKVNGRGPLRGPEEVHGPLLRLLPPEDIPEKGHGVHDARQLFQDGVLGVLQVAGIARGSGLKMTVTMRATRLHRWQRLHLVRTAELGG